MLLRVLGPVEVHTGDGRVLRLARRQERCLLGILALEPGRVVPVDRLCGFLWDDSPPDRARQVLRSLVSRVRAMLTQAGAGEHQVALESDRGGYVLRVPGEQVDVHQFHRLLEAASGAADLVERDQLLRMALALWHGPPLHNAASDALRQRLCAHLEELRLYAVEESMTVGLDLGRYQELVPELGRLVGEHPLRERLIGLYMRALHCAGRTGDALEVYTHTRERLAEQLGLDPGQALRELHGAILSGDIEPPPQRPPASPPEPTVGIPAQLPTDVAGFTGRVTELAQLDTLLDKGAVETTAGAPAAQQPWAVVISAVSGAAGVGKTALAIRWAHRVRDRFPDGQLYVNLRGYDPEQPMTSGEALARFLNALGVAGGDTPLDVESRAARYRSALADRRTLVVLDNAANVDQVRPLLPGTPSCAVVVTSRDSLAGLVALHGATRLDLDLLPAVDAHALLRRLIGPRVDADPDATAALANQCARLPLALRVAAELAASRPTVDLATLVGELADHRERLDLLDAGGDPRAAVGTVFSWSLRHLPTHAARAFRLLGLHPGPDFNVYAVAAVTDTNLHQARRTLTQLARAHLIRPTPGNRYGMHDLLRAYAASLAHEDPTEIAAVDRLLDYYVATTLSAVDCLYPGWTRVRPSVPQATTPCPDLGDQGAAQTWLNAERACLVLASGYAAAHGRSAHAVGLSITLFAHLDNGGYYDDALAIHDHAGYAARQAGDQAGEAHALGNLGATYMRIGQYDKATMYLEQAHSLARQARDQAEEARARVHLGLVYWKICRFELAAEQFEHALVFYRKAGHQKGEAIVVNNLGLVENRLGRYEQAADHHAQALAIHMQIGNRNGEATALTNLGDVEQQRGDYRAAMARHDQALAIYRQLGNRHGESWVLCGRASVHQGLYRTDQATEDYLHALTLMRASGDREGEAHALNGLGETATAAGGFVDAVAHHNAALIIATNIGSPDQRARAYTGLGHACHALAEHIEARNHYEQALTLYNGLGLPEAEKVRDALANLD